MASMAMKSASRRTVPSKSLAQARREIEAMKPGEMWSTDHPITYDEFNLLTPDGTHCELFEGVIYMPQPNDLHEEVYGFLFRLLGEYVEQKDLGVVRGSRSGVRLDRFSAPQPDILFVRKERRDIIEPLGIVEPPDMIMEIVFSDSSRHRATAKTTRHEEFKVPEFWYIDLPKQLLRVCQLSRSGEYQASFEGSRGVAKSKEHSGVRHSGAMAVV